MGWFGNLVTGGSGNHPPTTLNRPTHAAATATATTTTATMSPGYVSIPYDNNTFEGLPVAVAVAVLEDHDMESHPNHAPPPPVNPHYQAAALTATPATAPTNPTTTTSYTPTTTMFHPELASLLAHLPRRPTLVPQCPHCAARNIRTQTRTAPNYLTWLSCLLVLFMFWPLCWLPLVVDVTKCTEHYCPSCHQLVGMVSPYQDCCVKQQ